MAPPPAHAGFSSSESAPSAPSGAAAPRSRSWWRRRPVLERRPLRQDLLFLGVALGWVVFDQVTKVAVRASLERGEHWELASFFRFSHVSNDGAAFGFLGGASLVLAVSAAVAIVVIGLYYLFPPVSHWLTRLGLALILGGAVGNLLDRLYQGSVTDFINFSHFPAFNVADAGINIGIAAIIVYVLARDAQRSARHR